MKRFFAFAFSLIFLIVAAALIVPSFMDWSAYKNQATQIIKEKTGIEMDIKGGIGFSVIPAPRFYIEQAVLSVANQEEKKPLVSFERLEVNLELAPLFKKQVKVTSFTLIEPQITVEKLKNGKFNIVTPEIEALLKTNKAEEEGGKTQTGAQQASAFDMSIDGVRIKDGVFVYADELTGSNTKIQNINMDLSAQSLMGPFEAQGSAFYEGHALNIDAKVGRYDSENSLIMPKIIMVLQPGDIMLSYDGVVSLEGDNGASLQGQASVRVDDAAKTLSNYNIDIQQIGVKSGALVAKGLLTADSKTLSYKNIILNMNEQAIKANMELTFSPLYYEFNLTVPKDKEIELSKILTESYGFKKASFDIKLTGNGQEATIKNSIINLDDMNMSFSGSYKTSKNERPSISLNTKISKLDYDEILKKTSNVPVNASQGKSTSQRAGSAVTGLPMDIDLVASIDELVIQNKMIKGVSTKAKLTQNRVIIDSLTVQDVGKSKLTASGEVKDLTNMSGLTAYLDLDSPDITELAKWLEINTEAWPAKVKKANVKLKATGSMQGLDITTNISSMDAKIIANGQVSDLTTKPAINSLELQIKHKNMAQAIQMLSGAEITDNNLKNPLDFYSKISQEGQIYTLDNIKGDLSGITVEGSAKLDLSKKTPDIKANLEFGTITLQSVVNKDAGSSSKTSGASQNSGAQRWSRQTINTGAFHTADFDVSASAKAINYGAWPLSAPKVNLKLKNGALNISELNAGVFGGQVNLQSSVKAAKEVRAPLYFESTSTFKDVDLGKLSKALIGTKLVDISGAGSLDLQLKSSGVSPAALVYDLSGQGKVIGSDIILDGVDVVRFVRALSDETKPGDTALGIWKGSTKGGQTKFDTLDGAFSIQNGVVDISSMTLDGQTAKIETKGKIDLPRWSLSTKHPMSVKAKDGEGAAVPPFEIAFEGSLDNPTQTFGQGLLKNYLQRKIQRKLNKIIGIPEAGNNASTQSTTNGSGAENESNMNQSSDPRPLPAQDPEDVLKGVAEDALKGVLRDLLK